MTTDHRITADLAVVGRTSQLRPIELEATLRAAGAVSRPPSIEGPAWAFVYVARCARIWAGAAALLAIAALLGHFYVPLDSRGEGLSALIYIPKLWVGAIVLGFILAAYVLGGWYARREVLRANSDTRSRARRAAPYSMTASIAGIASFVLFFGMMQVTLGSEVMVTVLSPYLRPTLAMLVPALVVVVLGAIALGRMTSIRKPVVVGVVMLTVTIAIGVTYDAGPIGEAHRTVSMPLRAVLTATGTIGLLLTVTGIVQRIHRREDALLR